MKNLLKYPNNNLGITLVELIVALAILSIVISLGFRVFNFGSTTFERGESKVVIQQNLRLTSIEITKNVRYAAKLDIVDIESEVPETPDSGYRYVFINNQGKLEIRGDSEYGTTIFPNTLMNGTVLTLIFNKVDRDLLGFSVGVDVAGDPDKNEEIYTEIKILNIPKSGSINGDGGLDSGNAVRISRNP